jgi:hypothetical protein
VDTDRFGVTDWLLSRQDHAKSLGNIGFAGVVQW